MQIPSYRQLAKYIIGFGGVQGLNILISLVRNKFVSTLLGPAGMGLMSLFQSGLLLMQNATNFGLAQSGVRTISVAYDEEGKEKLQDAIKMIRSWSILTALLGTLTCIVMSYGLSMFVFMSTDHTIDYILLSPIVAMAAITGGELAILKAIRQLKMVAKLSTINAVLTLITSIPLYYLWGMKGIIPSLLIAALAQLLITIFYSYRIHPPRLTLNKAFLLRGKPMITLGIAFVLSGIIGNGAEFIIRAFLNRNGGESVVGLYNAGYMIAFTYAGVAFAAFESEYFPRLSRLCEANDRQEIIASILRQIKVSLLFVVPMVIILIPLLPYIIPLLFSHRFAEAVPMAQITMLAMIFRAITLPIEYLPLAKGDSKAYLVMELVYDLLIATTVCIGYAQFGITGTGYAIVTTSVLSLLFNIVFIKHKYL